MQTPCYELPVLKLGLKLQEDADLKTMLLQSINTARTVAQEKNLQVFPNFSDTRIWPTTESEYLLYLSRFVRWVPNEKDADLHNQEVYDMLCHFYWLVDQQIEQGGQTVILQNDPWFSNWLVEFAEAWGSFLDTPDSFDNSVLLSFINDPVYNVQDSMFSDNGKAPRPNNPSGWLSFNQFFARELNPGLRPITAPQDNTLITSPADSTFKASYPIDMQSEVTIKKTHTYSIEQLLDGSPFKDDFAGGIFSHSFLGPGDYHRFHTPVGGDVLECRAIQGKVFLNVRIKDGQYDAPDGAGDGYEFSQARGLIILQSTIGKVAILPIGMAQVSSVNMMAAAGVTLAKGDEFGYFMFGGSDIIMLFEQSSNVQLQMDVGTHYNVGVQVAKAQ